MKVALVHDWLTGMRGGEKVLETFCEMYPGADIYTLVYIPGSVSKTIERHTIRTSWLQSLPFVKSKYRWLLPLMPGAIESFRLEGYDLVLSSSHCVAKGAITGGAPHVCYCHTPMRYAWDLYDDYFNRARYSAPTLYAIGRIVPHLREWDVKTANRVGSYIANSHHIAERIERIYGAKAGVVHPPADTGFYTPGAGGERGEYLVVSAFAPYKRVDIAIEAFNRLKAPLRIIGSGEDETRLKAMAGPGVVFEKNVSADRLRELYRNAKALIYPGVEDFGIIPVEAMACGAPVIAFGKGGALETVIPLRDEFTDEPTGVYFDKQDASSLMYAIEKFEANIEKFKPEAMRRNAGRFGRDEFKRKIAEQVESFLKSEA